MVCAGSASAAGHTPDEPWSMAVRSAVVSAGHCVCEFMQKPPGRTGIGQPDGQPIGIRQGGAGLAGKTLDLRRKPQPDLRPDGIHHALRLSEGDRTVVVWCDEALVPGVDLPALAVATVSHGSKGLRTSPIGLFRLTRSPAANPCRKAPFRRARLRPAVATKRISVSRKASSTTWCLTRTSAVPVERCGNLRPHQPGDQVLDL